MTTRMVVALMVVAGLVSHGRLAAAQTPERGALFVSPMGEPFRGDALEPPIRAWFAAADENADGRLSREEFVGHSIHFFSETLDANRDGAATSTESSALWRERAPELLSAGRVRPGAAPPPRREPERDVRSSDPRQRSNGDQPVANRPDPMAQIALFDIAEPVMSCDADMSRRVTQAEFEACAERRFVMLDTDFDGVFALEDSPRASALAGDPPG